MTYKSILVQITLERRCAERLKIAVGLAKSYDAHLTALHSLSPYIPPAYVVVQMGHEVLEIQSKAAEGLMNSTEEALRRQISGLNFENIDWIKIHEDPYDAICEQSKYADLVVIGQVDPHDDSGSPADLPERLILNAGRPLLIIPKVGNFETIGKNILVAWNASHEAMRALSDALPFLSRAENVHIISVHPEKQKGSKNSIQEIAKYLSYHGIQAHTHSDAGAEIDVGNELLSRAVDMSIDLMVMGGYGHTRFKERVLGGTTQTILKTMTVPVLMSH